MTALQQIRAEMQALLDADADMDLKLVLVGGAIWNVVVFSSWTGDLHVYVYPL